MPLATPATGRDAGADLLAVVEHRARAALGEAAAEARPVQAQLVAQDVQQRRVRRRCHAVNASVHLDGEFVAPSRLPPTRRMPTPPVERAQMAESRSRPTRWRQIDLAGQAPSHGRPAARRGSQLGRERRQLLGLERVDDVVALAAASSSTPAAASRRSCFDVPASLSPTSGASSCVLARPLARSARGCAAASVAERLAAAATSSGGVGAAQALGEVRRAVDEHQRPRRVAVHAHVRPHVDARDEQQRRFAVDRDRVVVRDVEPEAAAARLDAQLRARARPGTRRCPSPAICAARPSSTLSASCGSIRSHSAANASSQYASSSDANRSTNAAGSSKSCAAARRAARRAGAPAASARSRAPSGDREHAPARGPRAAAVVVDRPQELEGHDVGAQAAQPRELGSKSSYVVVGGGQDAVRAASSGRGTTARRSPAAAAAAARASRAPSRAGARGASARTSTCRLSTVSSSGE